MLSPVAAPAADAWAAKLATHYYFDSSAYTQDWIDAQYKFINDSVGTLIDGTPPTVDQIFDLSTIVAPSGSGAPASASPGAVVAADVMNTKRRSSPSEASAA